MTLCLLLFKKAQSKSNHIIDFHRLKMTFPCGSDTKESACNPGDLSSIPGWGRFGEGDGNPCQYSGLENLMDRGA